MSDLEAKIKITAENATANSLESIAADINKLERTAKKTGQTLDEVKAKYEQHARAAIKAGASVESLAGSFLGVDGRLHAADGKLIKISESFKNVGESAKGAAEDVEKSSEKIKEVLSDVKKEFGKLGAMLASVVTIDFAVGMAKTADAMQSLNSQVRLVTNSEGEYLAVQQQLLEISNRTHADIEATGKLYVKTSRALKDYGYTQQEVLKFTESINNAMTIGDVNPEEKASALLQLGQALSSGLLRGEELNAISEAAPILLDTIAEYMGKSGDEIRKLGADGQLTADVIFKAISGASESFAAQAAKMPLKMGDALTIFQNNWKTFVNGLMNDTGVMSVVANVIKLIGDNLNFIIPIIAGLAAGMIAMTAPTLAATAAAWGLNAALLANPITLVVAAIGLAIAAFNEWADEIDIFGDGLSDLKDVVSATFDVISETIGSVIDTIKGWFSDFVSWAGEKISSLSGTFDGVWNAIASIVKTALNYIINIYATAWMLIKEAASNMPQFFSNLGASIANVFLSAIEGMVNKAIGLINGLIDFANKAANLLGMSGIDKIDEVSINRMDGGGLGDRIAESMSQDRAGALAEAIRAKAAEHHAKSSGADLNKKGIAKPKTGGNSTKGGGGKGKKGSKSGSGAGSTKDPMQAWQAEINAQKLAHDEMRIAQKTHDDWNLAEELKFWQSKLKLVDKNSKTGLQVRQKIVDLEKKLAKQHTADELAEINERSKNANHEIEMQEAAADAALEADKISKSERLALEAQFEEQRYQIANEALQERLSLAEQDPNTSEEEKQRLREQIEELKRQHELKSERIKNKQTKQNRQDNPSFMDMMNDGGKKVWQDAQQQMSQAFTAMLSRTQSFGAAMKNAFKSIGQTFIQEMVSKPLMGLMRRMVQESSIYQMIYGKKEALETASAAKTVGIKASETTTVVGQNAIQAASGAASSQASIPYIGPILAIAAMAAMMSAVMGLMGGSGGETSTTTVTKIPSAAGGWDIPAGINPLTQLHENEMVLPAEHAQTIRDMAGQGGAADNSTIIISTTGGDFIHKKDLAKLLKQMKRDFKIT